MMFGTGETIEQRMNHFDIVRQIQEDTGGFTAFIPWSFPAREHFARAFVKQEATAVEYLKMLALSRLYLENIENIQSSWVTPGLKTCQLGLALRRQRRGQHHDRGERGERGGRAQSRQTKRSCGG
jgi:cyclic dehypoxanthinyl futalosine synthase